jgi:hypothetical protein
MVWELQRLSTWYPHLKEIDKNNAVKVDNAAWESGQSFTRSAEDFGMGWTRQLLSPAELSKTHDAFPVGLLQSRLPAGLSQRTEDSYFSKWQPADSLRDEGISRGPPSHQTSLNFCPAPDRPCLIYNGSVK